MQNHFAAAVLAVGAASFGAPAEACRIAHPLKPSDVKSADTVVVGRISAHRIVQDAQVREARRKELASGRTMSPALREILEKQTSFASDYARVEVSVDEVLRGEAPRRLTAAWYHLAYTPGQPPPSGQLLIALRNPEPPGRVVIGPSVPRPDMPTVLEIACSGSFVFEASSQEARAVRRFLRPRWKVLSK